jgi:4-amino-4-deoxy-L-arabinose transferase-like glycosyltransferase
VRPRERLLLGALLAGLAVVLLFRLGAGPLQSSAEQRVWDVMRGMEASGNWLVPYQGGAVRLNKPPLYYWASTATAWIAGGSTLATLRLPAALAALALVWATWRWARFLGGPRLALLSAAALACTLQLGSLGRTGVAEMFLALFCTLGFDAWSRLSAPPAPGPDGRARQASLAPILALWSALAILSKATVALMLLGVPIALHLVLEGRWRAALSRRAVLWSSLAVGAGFLWYGVVVAVVPGALDTLKAALMLPMGVRLPGAEASAGHMRAAYFHLVSMPLSAFPLAVLFPVMLLRAGRTRLWAGRDVRFVALALAALFACFTLLPQKQKHYMLPLMPLVAILCAESVLALESRAPAELRRLLRVLAVLAASFAVPALFVLRLLYVEAMHLPPAAYLGVVLVAVVLVGGLLRAAWRARLGAFCGWGTAGVLLVFLCYHASLEVWMRQFQRGEVAARADYDAQRWGAVFDEWPSLRGALRAGPKSADDADG